jgi:cytochrome oxidase Cu insertion factor (SCO1/SenC/PrrC family)
MKRFIDHILISLLALLMSFQLAGQQKSNELPPFKSKPTLPPLELTQVNNKTLRTADIRKEPCLIIYFSPTCDHCIEQMKEIRQNFGKLEKIQVIMATFQPMDELKNFIKKYALDKQPNFRFGRDVKFLLPPFYKMDSMPYLALYDKNGKLITTFEGTTKMERVWKAFGIK